MVKSRRGFAEKGNTVKASRASVLARRLAVLAVASALTVTLGTATALAATYIGTAGPDLIFGSAGKDLIDGRGGNDRIVAGGGADTVRGGPGNDFIRSDDDWLVDRVDCGPGLDTVTADFVPLRPRDDYANCELRASSR